MLGRSSGNAFLRAQQVAEGVSWSWPQSPRFLPSFVMREAELEVMWGAGRNKADRWCS